MSSWLKSLVGYMLIVSITMQILPNKKYEQYVKLFTGFLLMILILQPLLKIGSADSFLENKIAQFVLQQERLEQEIGEEALKFEQKSEQFQPDGFGKIEIQQIEHVKVVVDD